MKRGLSRCKVGGGGLHEVGGWREWWRCARITRGENSKEAAEVSRVEVLSEGTYECRGVVGGVGRVCVQVAFGMCWPVWCGCACVYWLKVRSRIGSRCGEGNRGFCGGDGR